MQNGRKGGRKTSLVFTGCGATSAAAGAPQAGGQRRQVTVGGRRVKTIDVHAHCIVPEAYALMGRKIGVPTTAFCAPGFSIVGGGFGKITQENT